jgi:hypothetical protein
LPYRMSTGTHREVQTRAVDLEALQLDQHPSQYIGCDIDVIDLGINRVVSQFFQHCCNSRLLNSRE